MYDVYLDIKKNFKSSVNLEIDLYNESKILQYIPTTDLCDVIKIYIKSVLYSSEFRSTFLSGPYGKGKSYLMLIITYLLSKRENRDLFENVCKKIKQIDEELFNLIIELDKKDVYLLPVIINNNNFDDLNKNFLLAISNSLYQHEFINIVPSTSYQEALKTIATWKSRETKAFNLFDLCKKEFNIDIDNLINGLKAYDKKSFSDFTNLYTCVSQGLDFFTIKSDDIVSVYSDISKKVTKADKRCKGLFVIFDEFGSFLNNQTSDFVKQLNKIQCFAEKCNSSSNESQMHLCCILHKNILLYKKEKQNSDAFDTISGRFKQIRFDRSLEENYQIICSAIDKRDEYNILLMGLKKKYNYLYSALYSSNILNAQQIEYLIKNGSPFNPISIYSLIQVSEKVAQNERTLFTFLSDKDIYGFRYFISNYNDKLLNIDLIYDYFEPLIRNDSSYKILHYKISSLLKSSLKYEEHMVFKAIAIMKIINDDIRFNSSITNIAMSLAMKEEDATNIIDDLIERNILKKNINDSSIDFAIITDDELNVLLNTIADTRFSSFDLGKKLSEFDFNRYCFSNEYNFKNKMVRFYKSIYLEASKITELSSLKKLYEDTINTEFSDGLLINLINDNNIAEEKILEIINKNECNIIIRYIPFNIFNDVFNIIQRVLSAQFIINNSKNISETASKSLPLLIDDLSDEISNYLSEKYNAAISLNKIICDLDLSRVIYESLTNYYSETIVLNNEQLNKNNIQSVSAKARNNVIDSILKEKNIDFGSTSQEATIYNSFVLCKKEVIIGLIKNYITSSNGKKICLLRIIDILKQAPYGMRNGIIPLFVSKAISDLSLKTNQRADMILLYNGTQEILVDSNNISKACSNPGKYYIKYAKINKEKIQMVNELMILFKCEFTSSFNSNITHLCKNIKDYVSNLAPIVVKSSTKDNLLGLDERSIEFKNQFMKVDANSYELLFEFLPTLFNTDFVNVYDFVNIYIVEYFNDKIKLLYSRIKDETKKVFNFNNGSIKSSFDNWIAVNDYLSNIIYEKNMKNIYDSICNLPFNDDVAINQISFGAVGCALEDLNTAKHQIFIERIKNFFDFSSNYNIESSIGKNTYITEKNEDISLSNLSKTLYSNINEVLEEYGDSISVNDKAAVLKKILGNLLN